MIAGFPSGADAVRLINAHFDLLDTAAGIGGRDGKIGRADLQAILQNPGAPPGLREAVSFLLANPALLNQLDVAAGIGCVDGLIGRNDVDSFMRQAGPSSCFGPPSLSSPVGAAGCPAPGLDAAAAVDQALSGLLGLFQALGVGCIGPQGPSGQGMDTRTACEVLRQNFDQVATGKFKTINKDALEKVVASDTASPELKLAANTLLNNPTALGAIEGAHKDCPLSGGITEADLNTVLSPGNSTLAGIDQFAVGELPASGDLSRAQAANILLKHFDRASHGKFGTIDKKSLEDIVASNDAPPELKAAANAFLNDPAWLAQVEGAHDDCPLARGMTRADLNTVLSPGYRG